MQSLLSKEVLLLFAGIGIVQSFFLALFIFRTPKGNQIHNRLLAGLFFVLAFRVLKSTLWYFFNVQTLWFLNFGFAAHAFIGPLLFLYFSTFFEEDFRFKLLHYFHFLPGLIIVFGSFWIGIEDFWYKGGYSALNYYLLLYLVLAVIYLIRKVNTFRELPSLHRQWIILLLVGVGIFWASYFSNYVLGLTSYITGPLIHSGIIYLISFFGFKNQQVWKQTPNEKYKNLKFDKQEAKRYLEKLLKIVEEEQLYIQPDLSLGKLAKKMSLPSYLLSALINQQLNQNFSEFINSHRVKYAQKILADEAYQHRTISSIAFDSGFHSLSAFNYAFKKQTRMTPSAYRKKQKV